MKLIFLAAILSLPFAATLTYLSVIWSRSKYSFLINSSLRFLGEATLLLYGLVFLFYFGSGSLSLVFTLTLLGTAQLARRWTKLSNKVDTVQIESMQALGLKRWQIVYFLYIKQFFSQYLCHFFAVFCSTLVLVTPFLCIGFYDPKEASMLSLEFYKNLGVNLEKTSSVAIVFLVVHGLRFWLDQKTSFWEVEFG